MYENYRHCDQAFYFSVSPGTDVLALGRELAIATKGLVIPRDLKFEVRCDAYFYEGAMHNPCAYRALIAAGIPLPPHDTCVTESLQTSSSHI